MTQLLKLLPIVYLTIIGRCKFFVADCCVHVNYRDNDCMVVLQVQINCSFHSQLHNGAVPEANTVLKIYLQRSQPCLWVLPNTLLSHTWDASTPNTIVSTSRLRQHWLFTSFVLTNASAVC